MNKNCFPFYKNKYGEELLVDVVSLKDIKKFLIKEPLHSLSYYDITLITEGEGTFRIGDKVCHVRKGDVVFTVPDQLREWDIQTIADGYALIFEEEFLLSFFNDPDFLNHISYFNPIKQCPDKLQLSDDEYDRALSLTQNVKAEILLYKEKDKHILRAILYQILKYLDRIFIQKNKIYEIKVQNQYVKRFTGLLNTEFRQFHSVGYYADKLCLTPNYLNELVKKETGCSAKQMINDRLFAESKKLLQYSIYSVSEISQMLNFETASYFIRFFRNRQGITPLDFRNREK
ncbi:MAG: helix-turn-helix transcriptional regulator [Massilibacteroides sp.]|nr:helix-turn-helix transcriptional regulator [Massilibacteroides sp.]MDD3061849.1 helix-turn-helix transcriptional regulator [Massilibacteroides sp.]MDD4115499.1 helix-turn-helix transcriptional regulator [Massilibacteroides sp.]MDD4660573.1 helix-turn-helix transcriptional regulator [Massilibacteroides sp.]